VEPITTLFQEVGNRLLRLDPQTCRRLGEMQGKVVLLRVVRTGFAPLNFFVQPTESGVVLHTRLESAPDVTISAEPAVFLRLALKRVTERPLAAGELQLSGDIELGQRFQRVLEQIDIDWEEQLSRFVGDVAAHQLWRGLHGLQAWGRHAATTLARDAAEYLHEEARVLASRAEVAAFLDRVDALRADAERLEQRLGRLDGKRT
jgi:ubiquinone biosynthesis accessory factor UbiJ